MDVNDIKLGQKATVNGKSYNVLAKVLYAALGNDYKYYKVFLTGGGLFIYDARDQGKLSAFGMLIAPLDLDVKNPADEINYNGRVYKKDTGIEYERVVAVEFGELSDAEGECWWVNYTAEDGSWLSPGLVSYDGRRADYFGEDISKYNIEFVKESV